MPLLGNAETEWEMNVECPTAEDVCHQIILLKCDKAAGPESLQPAVSKAGGEGLLTRHTNILRTVWHSEHLPEDWNNSDVILIF